MLGLDPLYVANEGKLVAIVAPEAAETILAAMRAHPRGVDAAIIGTVGEATCWSGDHEDGIWVYPHRRFAGGRPVAEDLLRWRMHEMGIASSVLEAVHKELQRLSRAARVESGLRIGEFAGVDTESLRFCFEALVKGSALEPLALEIEWCRVADGRRGDELDFAYLELESRMRKRR